jgi:transcriptional regulator with XRE-family HTH domain
MFDWHRLRRVLGECRRDAGLEEGVLAERIGCAASTIYRVENLEKNPKHKPALETISLWVTATGYTLSSFFARVEGAHLQLPDSGMHNRPDARAVSAPSAPITAADLVAFGKQLGDSIGRTLVTRAAAKRAPSHRAPRARGRSRD